MKEKFRNVLNRKAKRHSVIAFLGMLASILLVGGIVACSTQSTGNDAISVVKKHLESEKNNDYDAWISTLIEEKQRAFTKETTGEFGVISLTVEKVDVSDEETQRIQQRYTRSELAQSRGWSDEYLSENMIVVSTQYTVDYDNTKVPYMEGTLTQDFILIRNNQDSPWLIWDTSSPSD